ncbi:hypothetical protein [Aquitalea magnusonii]|uniref:hypothetical protein n=1 Tax=Aquitalea magnusonii TaxID=332411 RepID=UPI000B5CD6D2|nr:hypothetical protein [Aquitalea magnusonii]
MGKLIKTALINCILLHHGLAFAYMPQGPYAEVTMLKNSLVLDMRNGLNQIRNEFPGKHVYIITINVIEHHAKNENKMAWLISNEKSKNCKPEFPPIIKYGQPINKCLQSKLISKYDSKKNYEAIVMGYIEGVGGVEFTVNYKREVNGRLIDVD